MKTLTLILTLALLLLTSCAAPQTQPTPTLSEVEGPIPTDTPQANLPNPASVYCEQQGNKLEIRTAADGSQSGVCIFPDGSECDEWAFFRGECSPASQNNPTTAPTDEAPPPRQLKSPPLSRLIPPTIKVGGLTRMPPTTSRSCSPKIGL